MFNKTLISGPLRAGSLLVSDILHWFRTLSRQAFLLQRSWDCISLNPNVNEFPFSAEDIIWSTYFCFIIWDRSPCWGDWRDHLLISSWWAGLSGPSGCPLDHLCCVYMHAIRKSVTVYLWEQNVDGPTTVTLLSVLIQILRESLSKNSLYFMRTWSESRSKS